MAEDVERASIVLALLALRVVPALAWIGFAARSVLLSLVLGFGASLALLPLALRIAPSAQPAGLQLWAAAISELGRGVVLGAGGLLPLLAIGWAGRISDALREVNSALDDAARFALERLYVAAALAVSFATGAGARVLAALGASLSELPLGVPVGALPAARQVFLELALLTARAFEIAVLLAAPVLLVVFSAALLLGSASRAARSLAAALLHGPLLPVVGLSAACLCISSILGEYPELAQVFLDKASALLRGLF